MTNLKQIKLRINGLGSCVPIYEGTLSQAADDIQFLLDEIECLTDELNEKTEEIDSLEDEIYDLGNQLNDLEDEFSKLERMLKVEELVCKE